MDPPFSENLDRKLLKFLWLESNHIHHAQLHHVKFDIPHLQVDSVSQPGHFQKRKLKMQIFSYTVHVGYNILDCKQILL